MSHWFNSVIETCDENCEENCGENFRRHWFNSIIETCMMQLVEGELQLQKRSFTYCRMVFHT